MRSPYSQILAFGYLLLLLGGARGATTYNLNGSGGDWSHAATWSPSGPPGIADSIAITGSPGFGRSVSLNGGSGSTYTVSAFSANSSDSISFQTLAASGTQNFSITNGLSKNGTGVLSFEQAGGSSLTLAIGGNLTISNGMLAYTGTLSVTGNIALGSSSTEGILGLGSDLTLNVGAGAGQLSTGNGGGGFAAFGANRQINLGASAIWGTTGFLNHSNAELYFGHSTATHTVTMTSALDLNGGGRTIVAHDGAAAVDGAISGNLTGGSASLTKEGNGTLELSGTNSYTGATRVNAGVLRIGSTGALGSGNLDLKGGVIGLGAGDFTRALGADPGQVRLTAAASSGFAAFGADRTVNLGGAGAAISWGLSMFTSTKLILNDANSAHTLTFANALDLNGAARSVIVGNGSAGVDAVLSGVVTGNASSQLVKEGDGVLSLTQANTYGGGTLVSAGTLLVNNSTASGTGSGAVSVSSGAQLGGQGTVAGATAVAGTLAAGGINSTDRVGKLTFSNTLSLSGESRFQLDGIAIAGLDYDQVIVANLLTSGGGLTLDIGNLFLTQVGAAPGQVTTLQLFSAGSFTGTFSSLALTGADAFASGSGLNVTGQSGANYQFNASLGQLTVSYSAIPEPSTAILLLLSGAGLIIRLRKTSSPKVS